MARIAVKWCCSDGGKGGDDKSSDGIPAVRARVRCGNQGGDGSMNDGVAPIPLAEIAGKKVPQVATMKKKLILYQNKISMLATKKPSKIVIFKLFEPAFAI